MSNKRREVVSLSLTQSDLEGLNKIALKFDCRWGEKPNVSELCRRLVDGRLKVVWGDEPDSPDPRLTKAIERGLFLLEKGIAIIRKSL